MTGPEERALLLETVNKATRAAGLIEELRDQQAEYIEVIEAYQEKLRSCLEVMEWAEDKLRKLERVTYHDDYTRSAIRSIAESLSKNNPRRPNVD